MKTPAFELPEGTEVASLLIQRMNETSLKPDSPVIVINRGRKPLEMTFDGNHIPIPVGYFETEYGAALHFKDRAVVPGTRNLEVGGFISWFSILGSSDGRVAVDPPEQCVPLKDSALRRRRRSGSINRRYPMQSSNSGGSRRWTGTGICGVTLIAYLCRCCARIGRGAGRSGSTGGGT